jgi:hypothetical protein
VERVLYVAKELFQRALINYISGQKPPLSNMNPWIESSWASMAKGKVRTSPLQREFFFFLFEYPATKDTILPGVFSGKKHPLSNRAP